MFLLVRNKKIKELLV